MHTNTALLRFISLASAIYGITVFVVQRQQLQAPARETSGIPLPISCHGNGTKV
jgi:hypothetical protein